MDLRAIYANILAILSDYFPLKGRHYCLVPLGSVRPEEKAKIQYYLPSDVVTLHLKKCQGNLLIRYFTKSLLEKTKFSVMTYLSMMIKVDDP